MSLQIEMDHEISNRYQGILLGTEQALQTYRVEEKTFV